MNTPRQIRPRRRNLGSTMLMAIGFVLVFAIVVTVMLLQSTRQTGSIFRTRVMENSLGGAQAVLNSMSANIAYIVNNRPPQTSGRFDQIQTAVHNMRPSALTGYELATHGGRSLTYVRDLGTNDFQFRVIDDPGDRWDGYSTARLDYELVTAVRENSGNTRKMGTPAIAARKRVTLDYIPLYQFAIFYDKDMELHPGPQMDVRGPVHSNGNMWLGAQTGLSFYDRVTAVGKIRAYNDFTGLGLNATSGQPGYTYALESFTNYGPVQFKNALGNFVDMYLGSGNSMDTNGNRYLDALDSNWATDALTRWSGTLKDVSHGIRTIRPPLPDGSVPPDIIQRVASSDPQAVQDIKFESLADLKITGNPGDESTIQIKNAAGTTIANDDGTGKKIWTVGEFFDGQQQTVVKTIDINMANVVARGFNFSNGVLYASTTPVSGDNWTAPTTWNNYGRSDFMPGIRITNAQTLPRNLQNGFTFATDRPLYTVGSVNTNNKATAVFASDSVTVLSQNLVLDYPVQIWDPVAKKNVVRSSLDNTKAFPLSTNIPNGYTREDTPSGVKDPLTGAAVTKSIDPNANPPSGTDGLITNLILVMGQTPSTFNANGKRITQSGGAHNVMRYLENWTNKKHTFNGSLICLYNSLSATKPWRNDSGFVYYNPPNRNYRWDNSLQGAQPPPGMLMFLQVNETNVERIDLATAIANRPN